MITIDRAAYAAEVGEPEELLDPLPTVTPSWGFDGKLEPKIALPEGRPSTYYATWEAIETVHLNGALVRFGEHPARFLPFPRDWIALPKGSTITIRVTIYS